MSLFKRNQQQTKAEEFSSYTSDLIDLTKLREKAMQRAILQPTDENKQEVERYSTMIECAQQAIIRVSQKTEKASK